MVYTIFLHQGKEIPRVAWGLTPPIIFSSSSHSKATPINIQTKHSAHAVKTHVETNSCALSSNQNTALKLHPMKTLFWNDFLHLWFKEQKPKTLLYEDTIWQYLPWSKCTRNTHSENGMTVSAQAQVRTSCEQAGLHQALGVGAQASCSASLGLGLCIYLK